MSTDGQAWAATDPGVIATFEASVEAFKAYRARIIVAAAAVGKNRGPRVSDQLIAGDMVLLGLEPDDVFDPPDGWIYTVTHNKLWPRKRPKTPAGLAARQWLDRHQPPPMAKVHKVLHKQAGLPPNDKRGKKYGLPQLFLHDGTLWARFLGEPGEWGQGAQRPGPLWTQRKLSQFYAAREESDLTSRPAEEVQLAAISKEVNG